MAKSLILKFIISLIIVCVSKAQHTPSSHQNSHKRRSLTNDQSKELWKAIVDSGLIKPKDGKIDEPNLNCSYTKESGIGNLCGTLLNQDPVTGKKADNLMSALYDVKAPHNEPGELGHNSEIYAKN